MLCFEQIMCRVVDVMPAVAQPALEPPAPFVRWVGGKTAILPMLLAHVPKKFGVYYEPFVGGGALFFALAAQRPGLRAVISDANLRLVRTYRGVRDAVETVIAGLEECTRLHTKDFYYQMRDIDIDAVPDDADVAACFLYLNRTCFNGLYRVNADGKMNTPIGKTSSGAPPVICQAERLRACSAALQSVEIEHGDALEVANRAKPGDFIYADPPYIPLSKTSDFTSYTAEKFGPDEQEALRNLAVNLKAGGVHVLLSNSSAPEVAELYGRYFKLEPVTRRGTVSSKIRARGAVTEMLIY